MKASIFSGHLKKYIPLYVMMIPCVCYYLLFKYLPLLGNVIAFQDYSVMNGILGSSWSKPFYKHFSTFFHSAYFGQLMRNTLLISLTKLICNTLSAILLALLLNEVRNVWFRRSIQTIVYLPYFLSWVIIQGILNALFSQSNGLINQLIVRAGGKSIPVFNSNTAFFWMVILSSVWKNAGYGAIIYLTSYADSDTRDDAQAGASSPVYTTFLATTRHSFSQNAMCRMSKSPSRDTGATPSYSPFPRSASSPCRKRRPASFRP